MVKKKRQKHHYWIHGVVLSIALLLLVVFVPTKDILTNPENAKQQILALGLLAPLAIILLATLDVIIVPIPAFLIATFSGYVFGPWLGLLFVWIGKVIGTNIVFHFSRSVERPLIKNLIEKREHMHFKVMYEKRGLFALIPMYATPLFPVDSVTMLAGLTKIDAHKFAIVSSLSFIPRLLVLTYFGSLFNQGISTELMVFGVIASGFLLMFTFRHKLKQFFIKEIHELEHKMHIK